jgi:hypothetical protein
LPTTQPLSVIPWRRAKLNNIRTHRIELIQHEQTCSPGYITYKKALKIPSRTSNAAPQSLDCGLPRDPRSSVRRNGVMDREPSQRRRLYDAYQKSQLDNKDRESSKTRGSHTSSMHIRHFFLSENAITIWVL